MLYSVPRQKTCKNCVSHELGGSVSQTSCQGGSAPLDALSVLQHWSEKHFAVSGSNAIR